MIAAGLDDGFQLAAEFFGLTLLLMFCFALLAGFVGFVKRLLG